MHGAVTREIALFLIDKTEIKGKLAFYGFHDIQHRDLLGGPGQREPAFDPPVGANNLCLDELLEDLCKKASRDLVFFGDLSDETDLLVGLAG